jgi:hypothetical protein
MTNSNSNNSFKKLLDTHALRHLRNNITLFTLMSTRSGTSLKSAVFALNSLQKAMMFSPAWPKAGPTGGAGFAAPALISSLMLATALRLAACDMAAAAAAAAATAAAAVRCCCWESEHRLEKDL